MKTKVFKPLFTSALIFFVCAVFARGESPEMPDIPVNERSNLIEYAGVVQVEGTAEELYERCLEWINEFFPNPHGVVRVRDNENLIIEGLHRIRYMNQLEDGTDILSGHVQYEFKIQFRDGRYRYEITNFADRKVSRVPLERWLDKDDPAHNKNTPSHLTQIDAFIKDLIDNKTAAMQPEEEYIEEW